MSPFIVTTKRVGIVHGADSQEGPFEATLSRRAVATLEEARHAASDIVFDGLERGENARRSGDLAIDVLVNAMAELPPTARHLPEYGGTVGPLPDGTVIEVERVTWDWLAERSPTTRVTSRGNPAPRTEGEVIEDFNAREPGPGA